MKTITVRSGQATSPNRESMGATDFLRHTLLVALSLIAIGPLDAQSVFTRSRVDADVIPSYYFAAQPSTAGCQQIGSGAGSASSGVSCIPGSGVSGEASASLQNGVLRSRARLSASNGSFAPAGSSGADFMAVSRVDYSDRITFSVPIGVTLTSYRFLIDWGGQMVEPTASVAGLSTFSLGALYFIGSGGPFSPFGWVGITRSFSGLPSDNLVVQEFEGSFDGTATRAPDAFGSTVTTINGVSAFDGLLTSNTLDFTFAHTSEVQWRNLSSNVVSGVSQELYSDFSNSARIAGLRLFDGDRDVTDRVGVSFASGFQLPVEVPEPSSALLTIVGVLGLLAHRIRCAGRRAHRQRLVASR